MISKIVLALDDSPHAPHVVAAGGLLASRFGASLHPVRALPRPSGWEAVPEHDVRQATVALNELVHALMDSLVAPSRVAVGEPWRVLLDVANDIGADLIVIGAHREGDQAIGATVSGVLGHAAQSVFVVRDLPRRTAPPSARS